MLDGHDRELFHRSSLCDVTIVRRVTGGWTLILCRAVFDARSARSVMLIGPAR